MNLSLATTNFVVKIINSIMARLGNNYCNMRSTNTASSLRFNSGAKKRRKYGKLTNREQTTISKLSWCQLRGFLGGTPKRLLVTVV